jgi:hypothetical protein
MKFFPGKTVKLSDHAHHAHSITDIRTRINRTVSNLGMQNEEKFITLQKTAKSLEPQT